MARLTVRQLEALSAADDGRILREEGGLVGKVRVGVRGITVLFRYEFKLDGRKRDHSWAPGPRRHWPSFVRNVT